MEMWQTLALVLLGIVAAKLLVLLALGGFQPQRLVQAIRGFFEILMRRCSVPAESSKKNDAPQTLSPEPFRLLKLLQRESRLLDLLMEDLSTFDDATIGSSVRSVHAKARKALLEYVELEPVIFNHRPAGFRSRRNPFDWRREWPAPVSGATGAPRVEGQIPQNPSGPARSWWPRS